MIFSKMIKVKLLLFLLFYLYFLKNILSVELCPNSPLTAITFDPNIVKQWNNKCYGEINVSPELITRGLFKKGKLNGFGDKQVKDSRSLGVFKNDKLVKGKYFLKDDKSNQYKLSFSGEFINELPSYGAFYVEDKAIFVGKVKFNVSFPFSKGYMFYLKEDLVGYYKKGQEVDYFETSEFYNRKIQSCYTTSNPPFNEVDKIDLEKKKNKRLTKLLNLCTKEIGLDLNCALKYSNKHPNDEVALFEIGNLLASGIHKFPNEPDINLAKEYYKKSASKGLKDAKYALAKIQCSSNKVSEIDNGKKILTDLISGKYFSSNAGGIKTIDLELKYCGSEISEEEDIMLNNTMLEEINEKYAFKSFAHDNLNKACFNNNISQPIYDIYINLLANQDIYLAYKIYRYINEILNKDDMDYRNLQEYVNMSKLSAKIEGKDFMENMIKMLHDSKY